MHRAGARINLQPHFLETVGCSDELLRIWARSRPHVDGPVLYSSWMRPDLECFAGTELYLRSMYEASLLPAGWAERLNLAHALIVPTPFVADAFRASGVTVPVEVVPDGIDPAAYPYLERPGLRGRDHADRQRGLQPAVRPARHRGPQAPARGDRGLAAGLRRGSAGAADSQVQVRPAL